MKATILAVIAALLMSIGLLATAIYVPATADWVMLPLMECYAPPETTGLPPEEYAPVVDMLTDYLSGRTDTFQHVYSVEGTACMAFNQKEQQHMADVQWLFGLCRAVAWVCGGLIVLDGIALRREMPWRTIRRTIVVVLAAVTAVIILAAIDFNSLFILFHKIAFTNDLWLLDPRTDLLIRLMPIGFFISYAAIIGGLWLLGMTVMLLISTMCIRKCKPMKGSEIP